MEGQEIILGRKKVVGAHVEKLEDRRGEVPG